MTAPSWLKAPSAGLARLPSRLGALLSLAAVLGLVASAACSSTGNSCVDSQCAAGNRCLPLNGEVRCRKTCTSNVVAAEACPAGYTCTDTLTGAPPFCVQIDARLADGSLITAKGAGFGQWGDPCQPSAGGIENASCDAEQGFYCYAQSPTDATAYCTRYDCVRDEECGPGFWCGPINQTPNADTTRRTLGAVQNVCLKREYCATCRADVDCPPFENHAQHCITVLDGTSVCSPECDTSANCPTEARCADVGVVKADGSPQQVCYPRADVCVGDGSLCSPCRVDTDCGDDGACVKGQYTSEKSCAKKLPGGCETCPRQITTPARQIACLTSESDLAPKDYCVGVYKLGATEADVGCWTPDRR